MLDDIIYGVEKTVSLEEHLPVCYYVTSLFISLSFFFYVFLLVMTKMLDYDCVY